MLLAHSIQKNATSLAQAQNAYQKNVVAVNTLITSVLSSKLPALHSTPPDWQAFVTAYEQANAAALNWVNNVMARLLSVPDEVQNYNSVICELLQDAKRQAMVLISEPANQIALELLNQHLADLSNTLNLITTFILGAVHNVQKFQDQMPKLAKRLQDIAQRSTADAKADEQQIAKLKADIDKLHSEIDSLTGAIIGLAIADGVALTLGLVATFVAFPVGALAWFPLAIAIGAATTFIAIDAINIKQDKEAIKRDEGEIKGLTADVATLHVLADNYAKMANQAQALEGNLKAILVEWQALERDVNLAIADIGLATAQTGSRNFISVAQEITGAITEWNAAYAQAGNLVLHLQVNNAPLQVGMSSGQVKAALAKGQAIDIIQYYNQAARAAA